MPKHVNIAMVAHVAPNGSNLTAALTPTSTSTQENSDTPREAPPADLAAGSGAAQGEGPVTVLSTSDLHKVSSPELASLAAKYLTIDPEYLKGEVVDNGDSPAVQWDEIVLRKLCEDVRRLAASVLSQADEGKPAHGGTMWRDRPVEETSAAERAGLVRPREHTTFLNKDGVEAPWPPVKLSGLE